MLAARPQVMERWRVTASLHRWGWDTVSGGCCAATSLQRPILGLKWDGLIVARWHRTPLQEEVQVLQRAGENPSPAKQALQPSLGLPARRMGESTVFCPLLHLLSLL